FTMPVEQQYPKQLKKCPKLFNRFF
uniref:Uncharacterized protein n=1 Tax=Acrobeloides nanus TaxID=290746 RepID=A0A914CUL9_9BILA